VVAPADGAALVLALLTAQVVQVVAVALRQVAVGLVVSAEVTLAVTAVVVVA
jgi:hypothetical protein